jgi:serine beta-lactamase-like protein LACTB
MVMMKRFLGWVLVVGCLRCTLTGGLFGAALTPQEAALVDAAMRGEMKQQQVVGLALAVIRDGEIAYARGYGYADRENRIPVTRETMFRWASISKSVTAVAAMQLVEAGRLALTNDVRALVPEFPDKGVVITVQDLLCHQAGIVHYSNGKVIRTEQEYGRPHPYESVVLALDTFKASPLLQPPAERYSYSTHGYILLSAVVERAGGSPFREQVRDRIAVPLGMNSLQPDYQWVGIPNRAVGYRREGDAIVRTTDTDVSWKLGGGGFISTIDDLARFGAGLINRQLVWADTEAVMWTPRQPRQGKRTTYALGFTVEGSGQKLKVSHNGSQEKARTRLVIYPRLRHGMAVMSNSRHADPGKFSTLAYRALAKAQNEAR